MKIVNLHQGKTLKDVHTYIWFSLRIKIWIKRVSNIVIEDLHLHRKNKVKFTTLLTLWFYV